MAGSHSEPSSPKTEEERRAASAKARADALAHAAEAEKLADAAAKERDAVAERLREALLLAAKERAAVDAADPPPAPPAHEDDDKSVHDVYSAMLLHEAAAVLNLHAQVVAVQNIRSLVPVVLDVAAGNYTRWREQFLLVLGKFSLQDHVLLDDPPTTYPDWARMD